MNKIDQIWAKMNEKKYNSTKITKMRNWKMAEKMKTNEVVWESKMTAMSPEKMFWTAEIELYRWVMSNGPYGYKKNLKMVSMFLDFETLLSTCYCWRLIFWCFSFRGGSEKLNFALKNWFSSKFLSKTFFCHSWQFLWKLRFAQKWRKK